jgi:cysteine desulfurase
VTSQIEHPSILNPCRFLEELGAKVTYVPVNHFGQVDPEEVRRAILPETILISVMHANNEVRTIQPIQELARIAREKGVLCHTDAAQTAGKICVDVASLGVDLLTLAGHKFYGASFRSPEFGDRLVYTARRGESRPGVSISA